MSKEAVIWADRQRLHDGSLLAVLRAVAWLADKGGGQCRKSQEEIAARAGLGKRTVIYALDALVLLECIKRTPRNKGRYGRIADLITLSLDREFEYSKPAVQAVRAKTRLPKGKSIARSQVHEVRLQGAQGAGPYNTVDTEDSLSGEDISKGREGTYEGKGGVGPQSLTGQVPVGNVIPFRPRGGL